LTQIKSKTTSFTKPEGVCRLSDKTAPVAEDTPWPAFFSFPSELVGRPFVADFFFSFSFSWRVCRWPVPFSFFRFYSCFLFSFVSSRGFFFASFFPSV
jgi:hypothetical protein